MALEISEFLGIRSFGLATIQLPDGQPITTHTTAGSKQFNNKTCIIRIKGTGSITWPNGAVETFDGLEFRAVRGGVVIVSG